MGKNQSNECPAKYGLTQCAAEDGWESARFTSIFPLENRQGQAGFGFFLLQSRVHAHRSIKASLSAKAMNRDRPGKQYQMSTDVILRPIRESDTSNIHAVALEAWMFTYHTIFDQQFIENFVDRNYAEQAITALFPGIRSGSILFDVAEHESRIIGFCNPGINGQSVELYRIYLLPAFIGQGIGQKMLERCEAFVMEHGANSYFCFVHKDNEIGKRFYLKSGFQHIPEKDKHDEWFMEKIIQE